MITRFLIGLLIIGFVSISGCVGPDEGDVTVVGGVEFQIRNAEYGAGKIIVTLSTNASVEDVRIDIVDEADQLLCTRYKDLIAGITQIEMTDCKAKERITISVSPPGGGIVTRKFTLDIPTPRVDIVSAEYELGAIALKLDANLAVKNTRIEVFDDRGTVLCTEYVDLSEGVNEIRPKGCGAENKITVSVTPPEGVMKTADFKLELPLLELKEGFKYVYEAASCAGCSKRDSSIYVTKETGGYWEGIAGIKIDESKKAYLMRWRINKDDLDLSATLPLTEDAVLGDVEYIDDVKQIQSIGESGISMMPLWLVLWKEVYDLDMEELITTHTTTMTVDQQNVTFSTSDPALYGNYLVYTLDIGVSGDGEQTESIELVISAAKPYLIMDVNVGGSTQQTSFKWVEQKEFSLDEYAGYSIEEGRPTVAKVVTPRPIQEEPAPPSKPPGV